MENPKIKWMIAWGRERDCLGYPRFRKPPYGFILVGIIMGIVMGELMDMNGILVDIPNLK